MSTSLSEHASRRAGSGCGVHRLQRTFALLLLCGWLPLTAGCFAFWPWLEPPAPEGIPAQDLIRERLPRLDYSRHLLRRMERRLERLSSYTATLTEFNYSPGEEPIRKASQIKVRSQPWSLSMKYVEGSEKGLELLYTTGGKLHARLGHQPIPAQLALDPDGLFAQREGRTIRDVGLHSLVQRFRDMFTQSSLEDPRLYYLGSERESQGRFDLVLSRPLTPGHWIFHIERDLGLPISVDYFDADGHLSRSYRYHDIQFDVPLSDDDFDPAKQWPSLWTLPWQNRSEQTKPAENEQGDTPAP